MGYRCLNNQAGYCQDSSRQDPHAGGPACSNVGGVYVLHITPPASCPLDPLNCGFFISWKEICRDIQPIEEYR
ncbi:unnamed protein product, partial [marine sediment metagenome]